MQPEDVMAQFEHGVTDSGMEVYSLHRPVPWIACTFVVHAGSIHDPIKLRGLAHLAEHHSQSTIADNATLVQDWFKRFGGTFDAGSTGPHVTEYSFYFPIERKGLRAAFNVHAETIFAEARESLFKQEQLRVLREAGQRFLPTVQKRYENEPAKMLLRGVPYTDNDVMGSFKSIQRMTIQSVRVFRKRYYRPENVSFVTVGGLSVGELVNELNNLSIGENAIGGSRNPIATVLDKPQDPESTFAKWHWKRLDNTKPAMTEYNQRMAYPLTIPIEIAEGALEHLHRHLFRELSIKRGWVYDIKREDIERRPALGVCAFSMDADWKCANDLRECVLECIERAIADEAGIADRLDMVKKARLVQDFKLQDYLKEAVKDVGHYQRVRASTELHRQSDAVTMKDMQALLRRFLPPHSFAQQIVNK